MLTKLRVKILEESGSGNQNRLADTLHINRGRMSQYATGTKKIPAHHLLLLSRALHCPPTDLIGYVEIESVPV
jgi:hypothetical protein